MSKFIAAMDHSGGSTGGVLERYGQEYTEETAVEGRLPRTFDISKYGEYVSKETLFLIFV